MKHRFEKSLHIVSNLLSYCHKLGCAEFRTDIRLEADATIFEIECPIDRIKESDLNDISVKLNGIRQHEVEQNYWELSGEFEARSDLLMVGMMVDEADVRYEGGKLRITVKRVED